MKKIILSLLILFLVAACGAKTKPELIAEAKLHEEYTVNKNYQAVYRGIADKFVECGSSLAQYLQRNMYSELGIGELYLHGADASGYVFLVKVKRDDGDITSVNAYSKISTGMYPEFMQMARMGAFGQAGCPK